MLKWPTRATAAIRSLFAPLQDIEVYVEDVDDEVFYRTLLKRVAGPDIKIARVITLGGREKVIASALAHDHSERSALFIIDGDLDWVRGNPVTVAKGLHQHNAYCIENLLICRQAITSVVSQDVELSEEDAAAVVGLSEWFATIDKPLTTLFAAYATARRCCPELVTVRTGVGVMCTQSKRGGTPAKLDAKKVDSHISKTLAVAEARIGKDVTEADFSSMQSRINSLAFPLDAVSGKDFVLPLLQFHLHSIGVRANKRALRLRLAAMCADEKLADLRKSVQAAARGWA